MRRDSDQTGRVIVIALYRTREESVERVHDLLARHSVTSESEPGCRRFSVHQGLDDPTCFALYEEYDDPSAFDAHRQSAHFRNNIEGIVAPLLVERVWRRFSPQPKEGEP